MPSNETALDLLPTSLPCVGSGFRFMEKTGNSRHASWARPSGWGWVGRTGVVGGRKPAALTRWVAAFWNLALLLGDGGQADSLLPQVVHCETTKTAWASKVEGRGGGDLASAVSSGSLCGSHCPLAFWAVTFHRWASPGILGRAWPRRDVSSLRTMVLWLQRIVLCF